MLKLEILTTSLFEAYSQAVDIDWGNVRLPEENGLPNVKPFDFYNSIASVYSSKIEGENIELDSFVKHKFYNVPYQADYTKKADDLYDAYQYAQTFELSFKHVMEAHKKLSEHLLSPTARGVLRNNIMFVMNEQDRIIYVACDPKLVEQETEKLFRDVDALLQADLSIPEVFYYAAFIHLMFVKIHPMQDGNGRLARLIEKWFIASKLGKDYWQLKSEKYYYTSITDYYRHLAVSGTEYDELNLAKALPFLKMLPQSITYQ